MYTHVSSVAYVSENFRNLNCITLGNLYQILNMEEKVMKNKI